MTGLAGGGLAHDHDAKQLTVLGRRILDTIAPEAGDPLNTGRGLIVAADPVVHAQLVEIVAPHLAAVQRALSERT